MLETATQVTGIGGEPTWCRGGNRAWEGVQTGSQQALDFVFLFFFSGRLQSLWDLNKGWNLGPGSENMESSPLDHQGIPKYHISELCLGIDSFERSV